MPRWLRPVPLLLMAIASLLAGCPEPEETSVLPRPKATLLEGTVAGATPTPAPKTGSPTPGPVPTPTPTPTRAPLQTPVPAGTATPAPEASPTEFTPIGEDLYNASASSAP